ncbi:MAG TPA: class I SAM-dependent methyltransferase [Anaerolineae bacterium]|nr:class I SAM-dependent methyltransferase [Anaerolineae bacterium]
MEQNKPSVSALIAAFSRGYHATHDEPKIFDDFLADQLFTPDERTLFEHNLSEALKFFDPERADAAPDQASALASFVQVQGGPITLSRARYVEDSLEEALKQGIPQYVILGAGMDTFGFRRPELLNQLQVFELDHPATQNFKRKRLAELGWKLPPQLHMLPLDFNHQSLTIALHDSPYDPNALTFFSWLGVTYYLSRAVVLNILREITTLAPTSSSIIFDYLDADAFIPEKAAKRVQLMQQATRMSGEPMQTGFDPSTLSAELSNIGWRLKENLTPTDIQQRFFSGRTDGYRAFEHIHFAWAVIR